MKATDIYSLFEAQQELFEVDMSPSNLRRLASAIPGVKVGIEFEMIVPDVEGGDDDDDDEDFEYEEDYDYDQSADSIASIVRFFGSDDDNVGRSNDRSELEELQNELFDMFSEYKEKEIDKLWNSDEGKEYFAKWVKENVDPDEVAEFAEKDPDLLGDTIPDKEDYDNFIDDQWYIEGSYYEEAKRDFRDEKIDEDDFSEYDFLEDAGIDNMSDVPNRVDTYIRWPFYTAPERYSSGGRDDIDSVGDDFSSAIGKRVHSASSYHSARRSPDAYSLEPDSSLYANNFKIVGEDGKTYLEFHGNFRREDEEAKQEYLDKWLKQARKNPDFKEQEYNIKTRDDEGEKGLEFISPPMSVDEMFDDLKAVKKWADKRGCYTNKTTGLHINVSVPDYSLDKLDYVKLAILLGDRYVLEQFGRYGAYYAESAMDIIKERAKNSEDVDRLLKQLKSNMETIASKLIHSGNTQKFTSINTKDNYIEFRSAGGDWLDQNYNKIEDTLLRFVVALDAACDPEKYKKEYYKGLYKILKPIDESGDMSMFAKYMAGQITRSEYANSLEQKRKERFKGQGIGILHQDDVEENDWEITYDDGTKSETIYIANTARVPDDEAAFDAAKKFKPQWFKPDTIEYITVKPFKFGPELDDLKLYRAEYGHKYTSVVAEDEEWAEEYVRLMDPEFFSARPDATITLTDENETSKRKISQMADWQAPRVAKGYEWIKRPKIWRAVAPGYERYYIAAPTRDEAIEIVKKIQPSMLNSSHFEMYVSDSYPESDNYELHKNRQETLIKMRELENSGKGYPRIWRATGTSSNGVRYYIAAPTEKEAIEVVTRLDPEMAASDNFAITIEDAMPDQDTYEAYEKAQEDLIIRRSEPEQEIDLDKLKVYRINNMSGYMYVVAENGAEAVEIASKMDPDKFGDVTTLTAQEQHGGTFGPLVITNLYKYQQRKMSETPQQSSEIVIPPELQPNQPARIGDMQSYRVENTQTGESRYFAATDEQDAIMRAREQYPAMFPQGASLDAIRHIPGSR